MNQKMKKSISPMMLIIISGIYVCPSGNHHVPGLCDRSFYPGLSYVLYKMGWYEP